MSKLGCTCGHTILDQTDDLPYKARVLRDQDDEYFFGTASREIADLTAARTQAEGDAWMDRYYLAPYPRNLDTASLIHDALSSVEMRVAADMYQCEECGKLWVETGPRSNRFVSFSPDSDECMGILASQRYAKEQGGEHGSQAGG